MTPAFRILDREQVPELARRDRRAPDELVLERREKYRLEAGGDPPDALWDGEDELRWAVRHWAARLGVRAPHTHVRVMTTKWASISTRGRLTLNADLLGLPRALGEYVVLHELLHLLVPNHGRVFKLFLDAYMPEWREREACLRRESMPSDRSVT